MDIEFATTAFVTLFVIIDPIGLAPLFIVLTKGMTPARRRKIAIQACIVGAVLLAFFGWFGEFILTKIGIGMPAFRISGGILLFLIAVEMLFEKRTQRREQSVEADDGDDPSVFPMAIPLIAGPGALATMILLTGQQSGNLYGQLMVHGVMLSVVLILFVLLLTAGFWDRLLGHTGNNVITRLLGMFLAALAVQFVLDGLRDYGFMN